MNYMTKCGALLHAKSAFSPQVKFSGINVTLVIIIPPNHLLLLLHQNIVNSVFNGM